MLADSWDLALNASVDFLAVAEHRLIPAFVVSGLGNLAGHVRLVGQEPAPSKCVL